MGGDAKEPIMTHARNRMLSLTFAIAATMTCFVAVDVTMSTTSQTLSAIPSAGDRTLDS